MREFRAFSYGTGEVDRSKLAGIGDGVVIERGALIFDPESVTIGSNVYLGHYVILRGYKGNSLAIGDDTYIGQMTYINSAGGVTIGSRVGIGPCVKIRHYNPLRYVASSSSTKATTTSQKPSPKGTNASIGSDTRWSTTPTTPTMRAIHQVIFFGALSRISTSLG